MKIIFCLSYLSVPITLSLLKRSQDDFLIVTANQVLGTFLKRLYPIENICLLRPTPLLSKNPLKLIRNVGFVYKYKQVILHKFNVYRNVDVFFFSIGFCEFELWLIQHLSKRNTIYYRPAVDTKHFIKDDSISAKIGTWIRKMVYGIEFVPYRYIKQALYTFDETFLQNIQVKDFQIDINTELISRKIIHSLQDIKSARILILCGGTVDNFVEESEYIQHMDVLITSLLERFGHDALAIKAHPRYPRYYSRENTLKKIPHDIPVNLIVDHFDIFIGYETTVLCEAANIGKTAISLLNTMEPSDHRVRDSYYIPYLNNNATQPIHYPESGAELIAIIENK